MYEDPDPDIVESSNSFVGTVMDFVTNNYLYIVIVLIVLLLLYLFKENRRLSSELTKIT